MGHTDEAKASQLVGVSYDGKTTFQKPFAQNHSLQTLADPSAFSLWHSHDLIALTLVCTSASGRLEPHNQHTVNEMTSFQHLYLTLLEINRLQSDGLALISEPAVVEVVKVSRPALVKDVGATEGK